MTRSINEVAVVQDWSNRQVRKHYQRELSGSLGNLLSRITAPKLVARLPQIDLVPRGSSDLAEVHPEDKALHKLLDGLPGLVEEYMNNFQTGRVLEAVVDCLNEVSAFVRFRLVK